MCICAFVRCVHGLRLCPTCFQRSTAAAKRLSLPSFVCANRSDKQLLDSDAPPPPSSRDAPTPAGFVVSPQLLWARSVCRVHTHEGPDTPERCESPGTYVALACCAVGLVASLLYML